MTVTTGDIRGANTDGDVQIQMGGSAGQSDWISLDADKSSTGDDTSLLFTRGKTDKFKVNGIDMGDDRWIKIRLVRVQRRTMIMDVGGRFARLLGMVKEAEEVSQSQLNVLPTVY